MNKGGEIDFHHLKKRIDGILDEKIIIIAEGRGGG